ncbi:MAG: helix-turn-helix domain-containing protein [Acidimicrobiia bacterium]
MTPRQMGSHLRAVRRRKGLSLSEVARGAGLNRRELVNYERGKAAIPESDLWVLAGSIGVDISELMPPAPSADPEVPAESTNLPALRSTQPAESIGDAVAMLRRGTEEHETSPHLGTLRMLEQLPEGKRVPLKDKQLAELAHDLGENPATIESNVAAILGCDAQTAARIRAMLLAAPHQGHGRRGRRAKAIAAAEAEPATRYQAPVVPPPAATEPAPTEHAAVDVFEELARLPEPLPLPEETALPDIIATPPAPEGAVELVDHDTFPSLGERFGFKQPAMAESTAATTAATAASAGAALHSGADAPPIDVTMRDGWTWSDTNADEPLTRRPVGSDTWTPEPASGHDGNGFDAGWEPPAADDGTVPPSFWEGTDDWSPEAHQPQQYDDTQVAEVAEAADTAEAPGASADPNALWSFEPAAVDPWIAGGWPENPNDMTVPAEHAEYAEPVAPVASVAPAFPGELATGELVDSEWPSTAFTPVGDSTADPVDVWGDAGGTESSFGGFGGFGPYGDDADTTATPVAEYTTDRAAPTQWAHTLDPAAADSGFVVDWGEADDA